MSQEPGKFSTAEKELTFNDHVDSLKHQLVVEVRHLKQSVSTPVPVQCSEFWSKFPKPRDQGGTDWPQSHPVSRGTPSAAV